MIIILFFQDLVTRMLELDPIKRITAAGILNHKWITEKEQLPTHQLIFSDSDLVKANMSLVFDAIKKPVPLILKPIETSCLAKRRAKCKTFN